MQHYTMAQLPGMVGKELALSDWLTVDQDRIQRFAEATDDHQWIHVDVERAKAGPFGAPIAHGYLTLSLIAGFSQRNLAIDDSPMSVNYGLNKVRFPNPVRVGSKVRARMAGRQGRAAAGHGGDDRDRRGEQAGLCGRDGTDDLRLIAFAQAVYRSHPSAVHRRANALGEGLAGFGREPAGDCAGIDPACG